mmetsp:Transcript_4100/g.6078  ORF Transcript_4100/g.6078 Transcript_4100/m.6078 type:complete len:346 (+) Transcript_4100:62-1099(+)
MSYWTFTSSGLKDVFYISEKLFRRENGVIFGRNSGMSHVVLSNDKSISRKHGILKMNEQENEIRIEDKSKYGIKVNGKVEKKVTHGSVIQFGTQNYKFKCEKHSIRLYTIGKINTKPENAKEIVYSTRTSKSNNHWNAIVIQSNELKIDNIKNNKEIHWDCIRYIESVSNQTKPAIPIIKEEFIETLEKRLEKEDYKNPYPTFEEYQIDLKQYNLKRLFDRKHFKVEMEDTSRMEQFIEKYGGSLKTTKSPVYRIDGPLSILAIILEEDYVIYGKRKRDDDVQEEVVQQKAPKQAKLNSFVHSIEIDYLDEMSEESDDEIYNAKVFKKQNHRQDTNNIIELSCDQ